MVEVVRKRQMGSSDSWTAGGNVVVLPTTSAFKARTPLPSLRGLEGPNRGDALIHDVAKSKV